MASVRTLVALVALTALVSGCRDDGRTLAPAPDVPVSQLTTTTVGPDPGVGPAPGAELGGLTLTSPVFVEGALLDPSHTCDGADVPPPLAFTGVPAHAAELAVAVTDVDAGGFVHWVIAGIPPTTPLLEPGTVPPGAVTAVNDFGEDGWSGPCPPPGDPAHTYDFAVYATAEPIGLSPGVDGRQAIALIEQAAVESDVLPATYASPAGG